MEVVHPWHGRDTNGICMSRGVNCLFTMQAKHADLDLPPDLAVDQFYRCKLKQAGWQLHERFVDRIQKGKTKESSMKWHYHRCPRWLWHRDQAHDRWHVTCKLGVDCWIPRKLIKPLIWKSLLISHDPDAVIRDASYIYFGSLDQSTKSW